LSNVSGKVSNQTLEYSIFERLLEAISSIHLCKAQLCNHYSSFTNISVEILLHVAAAATANTAATANAAATANGAATANSPSAIFWHIFAKTLLLSEASKIISTKAALLWY
jgi:hypothetical protein